MAKGKSGVVPSRGDHYESVSIRSIDNGFLICRSTDKGYSETYSATKPKIEVPAQPKAPAKKPASANPMSRAAKAINKR